MTFARYFSESCAKSASAASLLVAYAASTVLFAKFAKVISSPLSRLPLSGLIDDASLSYADTLRQITTCCSSIAVRCGVEVGDMSSGLRPLFGSIPNFFTGIQFGFSAFPSILGSGFGSSFSLNLGL